MNRYSRAEEVDEMLESIRGVLPALPPEVLPDAQRLVQKLEEVKS